MPIYRSTQILRLFIGAAIRKPKLVLAVALIVLAALAGTFTYTGFLVIGVLAGYLDTGRFVAGLLLAILFARFPLISQGRLRIVGLLPKPVRRPLIATLLALTLAHFVWHSELVPAAFIGFSLAFVLTFPWLRRALFDRMLSGFKFPGSQPREPIDGNVIEGEFREKKE